jgi:hypothetical protein
MSSEEYADLLADIAEGARLHYDAAPDHPDLDLALLRGDELYARGLARLAELGDLAATAELADVISLVAQARAAGDSELAAAVWLAGARAVRFGSGPAHERAKRLARAGHSDAVNALLAAAREGGSQAPCDDGATSAN